jgi:cyclic-di-GMP-binding protein
MDTNNNQTSASNPHSSLSVVAIDENATKFAITDLDKVKLFIQNLMQSDTRIASSQVLEELKTLNRQTMPVKVRVSLLERYLPFISELSIDLEDIYAQAKTPLAKPIKQEAAIAEALWLEMGYGYKRALFDLKSELINLNAKSQNALIIYRALHTLKQEARTKYLTYTMPTDSFWSDLHKVYYHALQLNLENEAIPEVTPNTISIEYAQILLMYLSNPQRLTKLQIQQLYPMIDELSTVASLRGLGLVDNPSGLFIVSLNKNNPPIPYNKNKHTPNIETDILLITIEVARQIHHQLSLIKSNGNSVNSSTELMANADEFLLQHLINYLGITPIRNFSRLNTNQYAKLIFGFNNLHILFREIKRKKDISQTTWQVLNIGPTGYALTSNEIKKNTIEIGELIAISDGENNNWAIGQIVWLHVRNFNTNQESVEVGIKLLGPSAQSFTYKQINGHLENVILVPEIAALNQPKSAITKPNSNLKAGQSALNLVENKPISINTEVPIIKTSYFEQFEYSLIDSDLS